MLSGKNWMRLCGSLCAFKGLYGVATGWVYFGGGRGSTETAWIHVSEEPVGYWIIIIGSFALAAFFFWEVRKERE
jgi:hypothetical protein